MLTVYERSRATLKNKISILTRFYALSLRLKSQFDTKNRYLLAAAAAGLQKARKTGILGYILDLTYLGEVVERTYITSFTSKQKSLFTYYKDLYLYFFDLYYRNERTHR